MDSSLICQILSNPPEITYLNETSVATIADMISEEKLESNVTPSFLTIAGCMKLPNILTGRWEF